MWSPGLKVVVMTQPATELTQDQLERFREHPLFRGLDTSTLALLSEELKVERCPPGQTIVTEGELARDLFVIMDGEIEVLAHGHSGRVCVALLGPGDWVGEMALIETQPRSASARALSHCTLLRMSDRDVRRLLIDRDMTQYAIVLSNIARELSRRLRVADRLIANSGTSMARRYVTESMRPPASR